MREFEKMTLPTESDGVLARRLRAEAAAETRQFSESLHASIMRRVAHAHVAPWRRYHFMAAGISAVAAAAALSVIVGWPHASPPRPPRSAAPIAVVASPKKTGGARASFSALERMGAVLTSARLPRSPWRSIQRSTDGFAGLQHDAHHFVGYLWRQVDVGVTVRRTPSGNL